MIIEERKNTKEIMIGDKKIGNNLPILIQSMTTTKTQDVSSTVEQIQKLEQAGCDIVRVTVNNEAAALAINEIKKEVKIPIVADIHFDYRLGILAAENGADKLRINPGNIGDEGKVQKLLDVVKKKNIPIRIGVNSGSIEKKILEKYGKPTAEAMVESAMYHIKLLEDNNFFDIVVSLKSSDLQMTIKANELISKEINYPIHLGVTEAGTFFKGALKSAVGVGSLLLNGIGDTIRISLTDEPEKEVAVAKDLLNILGIRSDSVEIISCPTCGRTEIDLIALAKKVEKRFENLNLNIKIAVMGCVVNGPGEAKEANYGIAGGKNKGLIFKKGAIVKTVEEEKLLNELVELIKKDYNLKI